MSIITVTGVIEDDKLGITLPHEHVLFDLRCIYSKPEAVTRAALGEEKVNISNLGILRRNPLALKDNLVVDDMQLAVEELRGFKAAGGKSIADVSNIGLGRDHRALAYISRVLDLNIIVGCGYYHQKTHPEDMDEKTPEEIKEEIVSDITSGIEGTNIRAGVIGEIGVSDVIYPNEEKVLVASAKASAETGAGIQVHIFPWNDGKFPLGIEAINILTRNGADARKIAINHVDVAMNINMDYCKEICRKGAFAQFDNFGHEFYIDKPERKFLPGPFATDLQRVRAIKELIDSGFLRNILISQDICHKTLLHNFGGWGYDHILNNILFMMLDEGIEEEEARIIMEENTKNFLSIDVT